MSDFRWTAATVAHLKALFRQEPRLSLAAIGTRIGISRNAVVGKVARLGLQRPPPPRARTRRRTQKSRSARGMPATPAIPVFLGRVSRCCWPIGEPRTPAFRYCDAATMAGNPYCAAHAASAFRRSDTPGARTGVDA